MGRQKIIKVADVEPLVDEYKGNLSAIARKLGVCRATVFNRVQESATLKKRVNDARQTMVDNAESALYKAMLEGNITALIFFLKTQGKDRGYTEKIEQEISGKGGGPVIIKVIYDDEG
jgi:hypothetical protein